MTSEEDITGEVAPSIDLEQGFFNVLGHALTRSDAALAQSRPGARWIARRIVGLAVNARRRAQLMARLTGRERTSEAFLTYNRYLMLRLCAARQE